MCMYIYMSVYVYVYIYICVYIRHRALHEVECPKAIPCFSSHVAVFDTISNCNVSLRGPPPPLPGALGINRAYSEGVWIPFWTPNCAGTGPERSKKLPRRPKTLPRRAQSAPRRPRRPPDGPKGLQEIPRALPKGAPRSQNRRFSLSFSMFLRFSLFRAFDAPRRTTKSEDRPKTAQEASKKGPKTVQEGSITAQDAPQIAQEGPKTAPRGAPEREHEPTIRAFRTRRPSGGPKKRPREPKRPPGGPQEAPKEP